MMRKDDRSRPKQPQSRMQSRKLLSKRESQAANAAFGCMIGAEGSYDVFLDADAIGADLRRQATPDMRDRHRANVKLFKADGTELDLDGKVPLDAGSSSKSPVRIEGASSTSSRVQVESTLKDMALMLKAAVGEALATDLTVSRTDLWNEAYGQDPQEPETGTPHEELLDCLDIFEAKMVIKDDGRGQLYEYLCRLPSEHSKGMVFDKKGFELIHVAGQESTRKALLQRIYGAWSDTGAKEVLRDFFLSTLRGNDCCGNLCDRLALFLFVSLAEEHSDVSWKLNERVEVMKKAYDKGCPVVSPLSNCIEVVDKGKLLGWFHILSEVGAPVPVDIAQARWRDLVEALRQLHRNGFVHGDPRLANVVLLGADFRWIDFLGQPVFSQASQKADIRTLMADLAGRDKPVQFGMEFDGWPATRTFIDFSWSSLLLGVGIGVLLLPALETLWLLRAALHRIGLNLFYRISRLCPDPNETQPAAKSGSKFWLVLRSYEGEDFDPPRAYQSFAPVKEITKRGPRVVLMATTAEEHVGEEEEPAALPEDGGGLRDYVLMTPEGPDLEYVVGLLSFPADEAGTRSTCEIVALTEQDKKMLVAVPGRVWHKRPPKRLLPRSALVKATALEVGATGADDRYSDVAVGDVKLWVGYLDPKLEADVDYLSTGADHPFGQDDRGLPLVPHGQGLANAISDVFTFHSAAEGPPADHVGSQMADRVATLEDALGKIAAGFKVIMEREAGEQGRGLAPPTGPSALKARAKRKAEPAGADPAPRPSPGDLNLVNLDPGVAQAAHDAGVSRAALAEMDRLVGNAPRGPAAGRRGVQPPPARQPLGLSESEDDGVPGAVAPVDPAQGDEENGDKLGTVLNRLTQVVESLAQDKVKKAAGASNLDALLDGGSGMSSGSLESGAVPRRNAAARRALRQALTENPALISRVIEGHMTEDLMGMNQPNVPTRSSARAWLEYRSRIGPYNTLAKAAWAAAGALDAIRHQRYAETEARLNVLLLMLDQVGVDKGAWSFANELSLEPPVPMHSFRQHDVRDTEQVYSRLLDPRWAELALGHLKDQLDFAEKRDKLGRQKAYAPPTEDNDEETDKPYKGPFSQFLRSQISAGNHPAPTSSTWPMPLPYPAVFQPGAVQKGAWKRERINLIVALLNWFNLGFPSTAPAEIMANVRLTARQRRALWTLERLVEDRTTFFKLDASLMGRSAVKAEDQHRTLAALSRAMSSFESTNGYFATRAPACAHSLDEERAKGDDVSAAPRLDFGKVCGKLKQAPPCTAKPIRAERLKFPPPPSFSPYGYLDEETYARFERPLDFELPLVPPPPLPKVKILAEPRQRLALYKLLAGCGRLSPVRVPPERVPFAAGMFAVPKDLERDRLVLDARPTNTLGGCPGYWAATMASASALLGVVIPRAEFAARDVFGRDCQEFADEKGRVTVALATLAMGDASAVEFAQGSHVGVLYRHGVLREEEMLLPNFPPPRGLMSIGVVLDDLLILEKVASQVAAPADARRGAKRLESAHAAYAAAGLLAHPEKGHRDAEEATFWGVKLHGTDGLLRASPSRLGPLMLITSRVCCLGLCSNSLLQSLVGSWTSVFLLRRRTLAALQVCFEALTHTEEHDIIRLSAGLRDEMWSWVLLGQLCVVDLRAQVLESIFATDASAYLIAAVQADLPALSAREFYRHSLQRGAWARLLSEPQAWLKAKSLLEPEDELPGDDVYTPHPVWRLLATGLKYRQLFVAKARVSTHINLKELAGFLRLEERIGNRMCGVRFLCGLDSQVALGALVKGRASSPAINKLLRRSLAFHLGCNLQAGLGYFRSSENAADDPTRSVPLREPTAQLPGWWWDLAAGESGSFQRWLDEQPELVPCDGKFRPEVLSEKFPFRPKATESTTADRSPEVRLRFEGVNGLQKRKAKRRARLGAELDVTKVPRTLPPGSGASRGGLLTVLPRHWFLPPGGVLDFHRPGCLHLSAKNHGLPRRLLQAGFPWVLAPPLDVLNPTAWTWLQLAVRLGGFVVFGASPLSGSFSCAVTPACRSHRWPAGLPGLPGAAQRKVENENFFVSKLAVLLQDYERVGHGLFWVEHPDSSLLWELPEWSRFGTHSSEVLRFDSCRYGTPWRHRIRIATNTEMRGGRVFCSCQSKHRRLRGRSAAHGLSWTAVAAERPARATRELAAALCRLDLEAQPLLSGISRALGDRAWSSFLVWLSSSVSFLPSEVFSRSPALLAMALRAYGNWLYKTGGTLHELRHTILAAQRAYLNLKPYANVVWELVSRWEHLEPPAHRVPIPLPILQALVALSWFSGNQAFAAITLLAYYGMGRIGEVLATTRSDLLLPADDFWGQCDHAYIRLGSSKTSTRGRGRVQHLKVDDLQAVACISRAFSALPKAARLFPLTPSAYRYRWNKFLGLLAVDPQLRLTPGGLRGGGAVWAYRNGMPIADIQWRMRLKHQATLEYYLQEVGAITALASLDDASTRMQGSSCLGIVPVHSRSNH
ncbi:unnamed protein product [Symbiodinium sp. CCMP2592]|nr:unnamed protein product [Symbiodinium sp. CCMP2592]